VASGFSRKSGLPAKAGSYRAPEGLFDSGKNEHKEWDEVPVASDELRDEEYRGAGRRRGGLTSPIFPRIYSSNGTFLRRRNRRFIRLTGSMTFSTAAGLFVRPQR
jgi:hypothetical protein